VIWSKIPKDTDILITHCPPYGILDKSAKDKHGGSKSLKIMS
jgi:Icc-related predicted phosphoesterase